MVKGLDYKVVEVKPRIQRFEVFDESLKRYVVTRYRGVTIHLFGLPMTHVFQLAFAELHQFQHCELMIRPRGTRSTCKPTN